MQQTKRAIAETKEATTRIGYTEATDTLKETGKVTGNMFPTYRWSVFFVVWKVIFKQSCR